MSIAPISSTQSPPIRKTPSFIRKIFSKNASTTAETTSTVAHQALQKHSINNSCFSISPGQIEESSPKSTQLTPSASCSAQTTSSKPIVLSKPAQTPIVTMVPNTEASSLLASILRGKKSLKPSMNQSLPPKKSSPVALPTQSTSILKQTAENTASDLQTNAKKSVSFDAETSFAHRDSEPTPLQRVQSPPPIINPNKKLPPVPLPRSSSTKLSSKNASNSELDQLEKALQEMHAMVKEFEDYVSKNKL